MERKQSRGGYKPGRRDDGSRQNRRPYSHSESGERHYGQRRDTGHPLNRSHRDSFSGEENRGAKRSFRKDDEHRSFGDRRRSFSERRSFTRDDSPRSFSERRGFRQDDSPRSFSERRSFGRDYEHRGSGNDSEQRSRSERRGFHRNDISQDERKFNSDNTGRHFNHLKEYDYSKPEQYRPRKVYEKKSEASASDNSVEIRLNKFIANSGVCSRREADEYIASGMVTVNGKVVTELGTKVSPDDDVRLDGSRLKGEKKVYLVMNKPKGFVTTLSDPHADQTVMDLISSSKCPQRVVPVGRLDKATTGVLLFTNDGEMIEKLTHPSNEVKKIYHVFLDKNLRGEDFDEILSGITLFDGPIAADGLSYVEGDKSQIGIEIHSGRNRIVRRIFEHFGYKVKKLDRVYFAGLTKKNLSRGEWRFLEEKEVNMLKMGAVR